MTTPSFGRARLARALRALSAELPSQMEGLLEAARFAEGRAALTRLADRDYAAAAVSQLTDAEAEALADRLLSRWQRIGTPVTAQEANLRAPAEVWVGTEVLRIPIDALVEGVDEDWQAVWEGPIEDRSPSKSATLIVEPLVGVETATLHVRAHIRGRARGERVVLVAESNILVRKGGAG